MEMDEMPTVSSNQGGIANTEQEIGMMNVGTGIITLQ